MDLRPPVRDRGPRLRALVPQAVARVSSPGCSIPQRGNFPSVYGSYFLCDFFRAPFVLVAEDLLATFLLARFGPALLVTAFLAVFFARVLVAVVNLRIGLDAAIFLAFAPAIPPATTPTAAPIGPNREPAAPAAAPPTIFKPVIALDFFSAPPLPKMKKPLLFAAVPVFICERRRLAIGISGVLLRRRTPLGRSAFQIIDGPSPGRSGGCCVL